MAPPFVLLHPFPLCAAAFDGDVAALEGRVRVFAPDLRGFGSAAPFAPGEAPSIDAMADDVAADLDWRGVAEPVVVGGISMGGYVALAFARRHRARLRGLVLADTRAEPDSPEAKAQREEGIARVAGGDVAGFVESMLDKLVSAETKSERPEIVERVRGLALRASAAAIADGLRALRDWPDARPGLAGIDVPTLVVVGRDDVVTPPAVAESLQAAIACAELVVVPEAGHLVNLEQPEAFRSALVRFAARL